MNRSAPRPASVSQLCDLLRLTLADQGWAVDLLQFAGNLNQAAVQAPDMTWREWLATAGPPSRLKCRPITASLNELQDFGRAGAIVVVQSGSTWVTLGKGGVRYCGESGSPRSDRALEGFFSAGPPLAAVIIEAEYPHPAEHAAHVSPWQRLAKLMLSEWPDIFTILIYSLVIALLTLATPVAVESLVNTVAFGRLIQPIVVLSLILFGFLAFSAVLRALQSYVAEIIQRRIFARVASDLAWRLPRMDVSAVEGQNMPELMNRFFDVVTVQKVVTTFLLDGIGIVLSTLIGMTVLAFYHPWLLAFDLVLLVAILGILTVLAIGAVQTSIKESKFKYATAEQIEEIARCRYLFKGQGGAELALQHVDAQVASYLDARKKHFRVLLRQSLSALMLQALASTVLLALGGWLVISGQLTLGQLIAAELIVTVIVSSVAKFGKHLESFYDLMAAIDKLGYLFDVPVEKSQGAIMIPAGATTELNWKLNGDKHVCLKAGQCVVLRGTSQSTREAIDQLYGLRPLESGSIAINGMDLREIRPDLLRRDVSLVRSVEILDATIADNITLGRPTIPQEELWTALRSVGLEERVNQLPLGTRCRLSIDGSPLSRSEAIKLCLARAIVASPRILLIDGLLDALSDEEIAEIVNSPVFRSTNRITLMSTGRAALSAVSDQTIDL